MKHDYDPLFRIENSPCRICSTSEHERHHEYAYFVDEKETSHGDSYFTALEAFEDAKDELEDEGYTKITIARIRRPKVITYFRDGVDADLIFEAMNGYAIANEGGDYAEDFMRLIPKEHEATLEEALQGAFATWFENLPKNVQIGDRWYESMYPVLEATFESDTWSIVSELNHLGVLEKKNISVQEG